MRLDWQQIKKHNWYHQKTETKPCFTLGPALGVLKLFGGSADCIFNFYEDFMEAFYAEDLFYNESKIFLGEYLKDNTILQKYYDRWSKQADFLEKLVGSSVVKNPKSIGNNELVKFYSNIDYLSEDLWSTPLFMDIFDNNSGQILDNSLKRLERRPSEEELSTLLSSPRLLNAQKYKLALAKILKGLKTKDDVLQEFCFINYGYAGGKDPDKASLERDLAEYKENKNISDSYSKLTSYDVDVQKQKLAIIKKYRLDTETVDILNLISFLTFWRDKRKIILQKTVRAIEIIGREIAKRNHVSWEELSHCRPLDIKKMPLNRNILDYYNKLANNRYLLYFSGNRFIRINRDRYDKLLPILISSDRSLELKGKTACPGKVIGRVKIIHGRLSFNKFRSGDILVSTMTRADFLPVIKKAKAIITDEGGITCHAAIVSREFGIPCVIGTRKASHVLKDNDLVEVDAGLGSVRIIN